MSHLKFFKKYFLLSVIFFSLILGGGQFILFGNEQQAQAQTGSLWESQQGKTELSQAFGQSGNPKDIRVMAADIIKIFLGLLGIIFVVLLVSAGFKWMTAQGNEEKVNEAKDQIKTAIIGLLVIVTAYAITQFVIKELYGVTKD